MAPPLSPSPSTDAPMAIKTMELYNNIDRLSRQLDTAKKASSNDAADGDLDVETLGTLDCLHFFGDQPLQRIQTTLGGNADGKRVLDIGTGFGGTARLLAHRAYCQVDALELQADLSAFGEDLTKRCGLAPLVQHRTGDFLVMNVPQNHYDAITGLLCFLHIQNWRTLFTKCFASLKPGGFLYVEDFFKGERAFTQDEALLLQRDMFCTELWTKDAFLELWRDIGFDIEVFEDATATWVPFVQTRATQFETDLDMHMERNGKEAALGLLHFYQSVSTVFGGGNLGGYTLIARKPLNV